MPRTKSIVEMRRELAARERKLSQLVARKRKLQVRLGKIERKIAAMGGEGAGGKRRGRKPGAGNGRRRRRARGTPLVKYLVKVLKKAAGPMRVKNVVPAVKKAGYKSGAKDFYGIVATALRDKKKFARVKRGLYKIVG